MNKLILLTTILSFNVLASDPCLNCNSKTANSEARKQLTSIEDIRGKALIQANVYYYFTMAIQQDREKGTGAVNEPLILDQISIKENSLQKFNNLSIKFTEKIPLSIKTTQSGGCLYIKEIEKICAGIERYSDESNLIATIGTRLEKIDFLEEININQETIKNITLKLTGREIEKLNLNPKEPGRLTCSLIEGGKLKCLVLLPYTANIKDNTNKSN